MSICINRYSCLFYSTIDLRKKRRRRICNCFLFVKGMLKKKINENRICYFKKMHSWKRKRKKMQRENNKSNSGFFSMINWKCLDKLSRITKYEARVRSSSALISIHVYLVYRKTRWKSAMTHAVICCTVASYGCYAMSKYRRRKNREKEREEKNVNVFVVVRSDNRIFFRIMKETTVFSSTKMTVYFPASLSSSMYPYFLSLFVVNIKRRARTRRKKKKNRKRKVERSRKHTIMSPDAFNTIIVRLTTSSRMETITSKQAYVKN